MMSDQLYDSQQFRPSLYFPQFSGYHVAMALQNMPDMHYQAQKRPPSFFLNEVIVQPSVGCFVTKLLCSVDHHRAHVDYLLAMEC